MFAPQYLITRLPSNFLTRNRSIFAHNIERTASTSISLIESIKFSSDNSKFKKKYISTFTSERKLTDLSNFGPTSSPVQSSLGENQFHIEARGTEECAILKIFRQFFIAAIAVLICVDLAGSSIALQQGDGSSNISVVAKIENIDRFLPPIPSEFPPLRDLTLPIYEKIVLPNGLRVFLLEDHELGLVGGELLVRGGGRADPEQQVGLAAMTSAVQRSGGSVSHPAKDMDDSLEAMAARIEAGASSSEMSVAFRCLREDLADVFTLFSEVVRQPLMPEDKLRLARSQFLGSISRRNDNPGAIAARELPKLVYGAASPYARVSEAETVSSIMRADLLRFHASQFRPEAAVLGIWGDFDASAAKALVQTRFGDWSKAGPIEGTKRTPGGAATSARMENRVLEPGLSFREPAIYLVDRPGLTQGYVRLGELGTNLADDDVFALDVLNSVLNGFGGRLFDQIRSREGLAYSVYGAWSPAVEHRGLFVAGGETSVKTVPQFVTAVRRVLNDATVVPPSKDELLEAKDAALNSFVFNFADSGAQLSRIMTYELFGIPQDFVFEFKKRIEGMTSTDVLAAAKRHLHPDQQPVLIVTDGTAVRPALTSLGLHVIDVNVSLH